MGLIVSCVLVLLLLTGATLVYLHTRNTRKRHAVSDKKRDAERVRLLNHLDFLVRHFHLNEPTPYVADTTTNGVASSAQLRCWYCQRMATERHEATCPWDYVHRHIRYKGITISADVPDSHA